MPFFPRFNYPATSTYSTAFPNDIFRLLEETQNALAAQDNATGSTSRRAFSPNFDVHETEKEYVLEGELPGLDDKKKLSIEFTDDKTLLVRGNIERSVKRYSDDQGKIQTIEEGEKQGQIEGGKEGEKAKEGEHKEGEQKEQQKTEGRPKYWVSERTVGEFSRCFSFPGAIDVDAVKANLEHGILKIVVPKKEKPASRRIELN